MDLYGLYAMKLQAELAVSGFYPSPSPGMRDHAIHVLRSVLRMGGEARNAGGKALGFALWLRFGPPLRSETQAK